MAQTQSTSIGVVPILTVVFVLAKLFGYTDMSWLWVFSPLWLPLAIILAVTVVFLVILGLIGLILLFID